MTAPIIANKLIDQVNSAKAITVLTGAGISAESGIPTFREAQTGLWARYNPEELATPQAFQANPKLVWEWYLWRRGLIAEAAPNPGHIALAELEARHPQLGSRFTLITQNVDGLHQQAGSKNIIKLHGNINREKCFDCDRPNPKSFDWQPTTGEIPRCEHCGGLLRPDVVWFGEGLPPTAIQTAWEAAENCNVFFSIGTSALVQPAASLPMVALQNEAIVIEINSAQTPLTNYATFSIQGAAGEVLPRLLTKLKFPGK